MLQAVVVVAQVVDRWYSVRASQVRVPGWTLGSFQFRVVVDLISLSIWAFSDQQGQRTSLFFPFSFNQHCHNFFFSCDEKIRKINPKKGRYGLFNDALQDIDCILFYSWLLVGVEFISRLEIYRFGRQKMCTFSSNQKAQIPAEQ